MERDSVSTGRPSKFSEALANRICVEIAASTRSLAAVCKLHPDFPDPATIHRWIADGDPAKEEFRRNYARAKLAQADLMAQEIIDIADDGLNDTQIDDEGREIVNHDHIARSKLRIDARKWAASKLAPKKYGDRVELAGDQDAPLKTINEVTVKFIRPGDKREDG